MTHAALLALAGTFGKRSATRTEADVQQSIGAFLKIADSIGLTDQAVDVRAEEQTNDGTRRRIDITYGRLVIEVKKDLSSARAVSLAEPQLRDYLMAKRNQTGDEYVGILTDGVEWRLYTLVGDSLKFLTHFKLSAPDDDSVEHLLAWLDSILLLGPRLKATQERIVERLGAGSPRFLVDRARLGQLFEANRDRPEVQLKKQLWSRLLRTALGTNFGSDDGLFIDHTMLVMEAEIIAHLVLGLDPATYTPMSVLSGDVFHGAGITNVVEADFFDWPAEVPGGHEVVSDLIREIAKFDWDDVQHDILKGLYEAIISPAVRKQLGEYYTPDWLAKRIVDEQVLDPLNQRVGDLSCGSGTFVFHAVRRFLAAAEDAGMSNVDAIDLLQDRVFGMDIHPVSVVLARVTYLLAIGTERLADRNALTVPIYLGDSIQWGRGSHSLLSDAVKIPVDAEDLAAHDTESYETLFSTGSELSIPLSSIDEPATLDLLISELTELAQTHTVATNPLPDASAILDRYNIHGSDRSVLEETFSTLAELNADGRDHIWGYFVRNQIRPIWLGLPHRQLDVLVGNPPWLAYRFMTRTMQQQFKLMSENRNLWHGGRYATHQDLVGLFVARTVELFLRDGGQFALIVPYSALSRVQHDGFRAGKWLNTGTDQITAQFGESWDLADIRPSLFPVPSAVVFGTKTRQDAVPLPLEVRRFAGRPDALTEVSDVVEQLTADDLYHSPYVQRAVQGATLVPRVAWMVDEVPPGPLGRPVGVAEVVSNRSTLEKAPWKHVPDVRGTVEAQFVYDVLQGSSVVPYRVVWPIKAVLPIVEGNLLTSDASRSAYPLLARRWEQIDSIWLEGRTDGNRLGLIERLDYQGGIRRQLPGAPVRVLYPRSGNRIAAAVCEDPTVVIEQTLYWVQVATRQEADYLVAILNSDYVAERTARIQSRGLFGPRDIVLLPWRLPIESFDADNEDHVRLAALGAAAAREVAALDFSDVTNFQTARARARRALVDSGTGPLIEEAVEALLTTAGGVAIELEPLEDEDEPDELEGV